MTITRPAIDTKYDFVLSYDNVPSPFRVGDHVPSGTMDSRGSLVRSPHYMEAVLIKTEQSRPAQKLTSVYVKIHQQEP